jgi:hypothetical protein
MNIILNDKTSAILHKGRPLPDPPKTWKRIRTVGHNIGNLYNPGTMAIYEAKDKTLRYEIYRDGCFYAYYGRIDIIGGIE